jgi:hypothetical protein
MKAIIILLLALALAACASTTAQPTPLPTTDVGAIQTRAAINVLETLTATAPTATSKVSETPTGTNTPIPTDTATFTATPTPSITPTSTPVPSTTLVPASPAPVPTPDLKSIVLSLNDMPPGFTQDPGQTGPARADELAKTAQYGRISAYYSAFAKSGIDILNGTSQVQSAASLFKTLDGAHAYFGHLDQSFRDDGMTLEQVSMAPLGDESKAFKAPRSAPSDKIQWLTYLVMARKGIVVIYVNTTATEATATIDDAVRFVGIMLSRVR